MADGTRLDGMVRWFKNNRLFSLILLCSVILVGASQLLDAISSLVHAGREVVRVPRANELAGRQVSDATLLKVIGSKGNGLGYFNYPQYIALDGNGGVIVGENDDKRTRIQRFEINGTPVNQTFLTNGGSSASIYTMSAKNRILIVGSVNNIFEFDINSGKLLNTTKLGEWDQDFDVVASGLSSDGSVIISYTHKTEDSDGNEHHNMFICKYLHSLQNCVQVNLPDEGDYTFPSDFRPRLAVDGEDNVYLLNNNNGFVYKVSSKGEFLNRFGGDEEHGGHLENPFAIAVDGKNLVYVKEPNGVQIFDGTGRYMKTIVLPVSGEGSTTIYDMVFDLNHNLWAVHVDRVCEYRIDVQPNG